MKHRYFKEEKHLSERERTFVLQMAQHGDATKAVHAIYAHLSDQAARVVANGLMKRRDINEHIDFRSATRRLNAMLTKYDHFRAGERAENIVRKPAKRFTRRVEISPNAKTHQVVEESIRALLEGFKETHDPKLEARNIKVELLCESYDTMFNAGDFFPKAYEIKSVLEKRGFKRAFFYINGRKSKTPALNFTVSYWDVDPGDPFTGTPYYELMRTEG